MKNAVGNLTTLIFILYSKIAKYSLTLMTKHLSKMIITGFNFYVSVRYMYVM